MEEGLQKCFIIIKKKNYIFQVWKGFENNIRPEKLFAHIIIIIILYYKLNFATRGHSNNTWHTKGGGGFAIGPCIPNFYLKFRVEFWVGTSFRESRWDELNVIFFAKMEITKKRDYRNSRKWKSQKNTFFRNFFAIFCKN